ncbi:DNA-binding WRKY transcription factor [Tanacetum coccineum]
MLRTTHDPKYVITTYEGKQNYDLPTARSSSSRDVSGPTTSVMYKLKRGWVRGWAKLYPEADSSGTLLQEVCFSVLLFFLPSVCSVKRVVVTSSLATTVYNASANTSEVVVDETWFSNITDFLSKPSITNKTKPGVDVHGTWVCGKRVKHEVFVLLKEGDTVKIRVQPFSRAALGHD